MEKADDLARESSAAPVPGNRGRLRNVAGGTRAACAMVAGAVTGAAVSLFTLPAAAVLIGWDATAVIFLTWVWSAVWRMDPGTASAHASREDPSNTVAEVLVAGAGTSMLAAVGLALVKASTVSGGMKAYLIAVGAASVVLSWAVVHTVYALRYARAFYSQPAGGIEFNETEPPAYLDFAYLAFTIGMTFQVSDTNITSKRIRRLALHHGLLSYLFGAVILAVAINVVASLLR